jgi:hypothetical protein
MTKKRTGLYLKEKELKIIVEAFDQIISEWNTLTTDKAIVCDKIESHLNGWNRKVK